MWPLFSHAPDALLDLAFPDGARSIPTLHGVVFAIFTASGTPRRQSDPTSNRHALVHDRATNLGMAGQTDYTSKEFSEKPARKASAPGFMVKSIRSCSIACRTIRKNLERVAGQVGRGPEAAPWTSPETGCHVSRSRMRNCRVAVRHGRSRRGGPWARPTRCFAKTEGVEIQLADNSVDLAHSDQLIEHGFPHAGVRLSLAARPVPGDRLQPCPLPAGDPGFPIGHAALPGAARHRIGAAGHPLVCGERASQESSWGSQRSRQNNDLKRTDDVA
jgi:hypothetical protein